MRLAGDRPQRDVRAALGRLPRGCAGDEPRLLPADDRGAEDERVGAHVLSGAVSVGLESALGRVFVSRRPAQG